MTHPIPENESVSHGKITYLAVPYPLPKAWRDELINHAISYKYDKAHYKSIDMRMRASIGVLVTRPMAKLKGHGA